VTPNTPLIFGVIPTFQDATTAQGSQNVGFNILGNNGFPMSAATSTGLFTVTLTASQGGQAVLSNTIHVNVAPIPLPAAGWLLLSGIGALGFAARRRKQRIAA